MAGTPNYHTIPSNVPDQLDARKGCTPACAIGILTQMGQVVPDEATLVRAMYGYQNRGSGFDLLKTALKRNGVDVQVEQPENLGQRIMAICSDNHPVLVAVKGGSRPHCVVVESGR